jgi:neutral ceramidase
MFASVLAASLLSGLTYRLGAADISPPEPLPLGGYTARGGKLCELPGDKIEARCLVIEKPGLRVALVSADLLTIPESLRDEVQKKLPSDLKLMLIATHTHCAPDSQMLNRKMDFGLPGIAKFSEKWMKWYSERIASSVLGALKGPASPLQGTLQIGHRGLNRGRRALARPDTLAVQMVARNEPILTEYEAHPVLYGPERNRTSPDYPGLIRGSRGLFLPGAIGDVSPASTGTTPDEQVANMGKAFKEGGWTSQPWKPEPFEFLTLPLTGVKVQPNPEFSRQNKIPQALGDSIVKRFAPESGYLSLLRLGKLAFVGIPGEPTAELGRRIQSFGVGHGFSTVLTISHCNGWMGYILTPEDYDRGGYEASLAFHGREFGNLIVDKAKEGLRRLSGLSLAPR